eukprot:GFUD01000026.1.p1 GENE.GFUD01000026.1~~GFUD01000026.1.p1  ORF type:complete len:394 (-),score=106.37 GFUD01000026.1:174-1355(-)
MANSNLSNVDSLVKNGGKPSSSLTFTALYKRPGSDGSEEEKEGTGQIRVGREFQAVPPPFVPPSERSAKQCPERALLVWSPRAEEDTKLDKFIHIAKETYGYNAEQALGMLFWHEHDMDRALLDLANFTPFPDQWSVEDKVLFEQAFQFHGKKFQRIQQMLPDKGMAALVKYYYSWKKTRARTSLMDRQARKLTMVREEGLFGEENFTEAGSDSDEKEVTEPMKQVTGTRRRDGAKLPVSLRNQSLPPIGMSLKLDDLVVLATGLPGQGEAMLQGLDREMTRLDREIASFKRLVQNNKQLLSSLRRKTRERDITDCRVSKPDHLIRSRWTEQELLLASQGVKMFGRDFSAIASILGTKNAGHVQTFFDTYRVRFGLDAAYQEWLAESGTPDTK